MVSAQASASRLHVVDHGVDEADPHRLVGGDVARQQHHLERLARCGITCGSRIALTPEIMPCLTSG